MHSFSDRDRGWRMFLKPRYATRRASAPAWWPISLTAGCKRFSSNPRLPIYGWDAELKETGPHHQTDGDNVGRPKRPVHTLGRGLEPVTFISRCFAASA